MTDDDRTVSGTVSADVYDEFQSIKDELDVTNGEAIRALIDRYNGERRERPELLVGPTARVGIPRRGRQQGKAYVNINLDENGDPFETFITVGDSGGEINSWAEALAKTLSSALRAGVDPEILADDLFGIRGPHAPAIDNGDYIYSVPDAVGVVMKRLIEDKLDPAQPVRGTTNGTKGVTD